jgi:hypothetical protein
LWHQLNHAAQYLSDENNQIGGLVMTDSPVLSVHIPPAFRIYTGGHGEITASGDTVAELLNSVCHEFPAIGSHLLTNDGQLQTQLDLYLGGERILDLATPIDMQEVLSVVTVR